MSFLFCLPDIAGHCRLSLFLQPSGHLLLHCSQLLSSSRHVLLFVPVWPPSKLCPQAICLRSPHFMTHKYPGYSHEVLCCSTRQPTGLPAWGLFHKHSPAVVHPALSSVPTSAAQHSSFLRFVYLVEPTSIYFSVIMLLYQVFP